MELATADKIIHTDFLNGKRTLVINDLFFYSFILHTSLIDFDDIFDDDNYH